MSEPRLRPATVTDLPLILRAERDYISAIEPDQTASWTAAIDGNLALWIAQLDRTTILELSGHTGASAQSGYADDWMPAGFVMWMPESDAAATLITIQVLAAYRRRGLGRLLLRVFADQARAGGARTLRLGVHEHNPARSLYEQAGYELTGRDGRYMLYELNTSPDEPCC